LDWPKAIPWTGANSKTAVSGRWGQSPPSKRFGINGNFTPGTVQRLAGETARVNRWEAIGYRMECTRRSLVRLLAEMAKDSDVKVEATRTRFHSYFRACKHIGGRRTIFMGERNGIGMGLRPARAEAFGWGD
jgi:hypothetical protein